MKIRHQGDDLKRIKKEYKLQAMPRVSTGMLAVPWWNKKCKKSWRKGTSKEEEENFEHIGGCFVVRLWKEKTMLMAMPTDQDNV